MQRLFGHPRSLGKEGLAMASFQDVQAKDGESYEPKRGNDGTGETTVTGKQLQDSLALLLTPGPEVDRLAMRFSHFFQEAINQSPQADSENVQLFKYLKDVMLKASTTTLMGPEMMRLSPDFARTFWDFDEALLLGLPDRGTPDGSSVRTKFLDAIAKYIESRQELSCTIPEKNPSFADAFGSKLFGRYVRHLGLQFPDAPASQKAQHLMSTVWA